MERDTQHSSLERWELFLLTCDLHFFGSSCQHLSGHEVDLGVELSLHAPLDPQHLTERVLIAESHLKLLPGLPVGLGGLEGKGGREEGRERREEEY